MLREKLKLLGNRLILAREIRRIKKDKEVLMFKFQRYPYDDADIAFFRQITEVCKERGIDYIILCEDSDCAMDIATREKTIEILQNKIKEIQTSIDVDKLEQELKEEGIKDGI